MARPERTVTATSRPAGVPRPQACGSPVRGGWKDSGVGTVLTELELRLRAARQRTKERNIVHVSILKFYTARRLLSDCSVLRK